MKRNLLAGLALAALIFCGDVSTADARDGPVRAHHAKALPAPAPSTEYNWTGFYAGVNMGASWGSYDPRTSTAPNQTLILPADIAAVDAAGFQSIKPLGFVGGGQIGYNWQFGRTLFGLEGDLDYLHLIGEANSGAVAYSSGPFRLVRAPFFSDQFVVSSYANANWLLTLRPRIGFTANNWLFYATGGLALANLNGQFLFTDRNAFAAVTGIVQESNVDALTAGYAVGGGVEAGITDRLSLKAEYLFLNFGHVLARQTSSNIVPSTEQDFIQSMNLTANLFRVGLNYRFGVDDPAIPNAGPLLALKAPAFPALPPTSMSNWNFDVGTRLWLSSGTVGAPQPLLGFPPLPSDLHSRLTFKDIEAYSGETFARVDHSSGFFVKGFLGAGGIASGKLIDEDFPGSGGAYSNTVSSTSGSLAYATVDLGYTFLKAAGAKLGAFVGYNYYAQHINGFGCTQLAGDTTCRGVSPTILGIAEDDYFNSLRVGLSAEYRLTDKLKFTADAAYLPWTEFRGQDDHNLRELLGPEAAQKGDGVMLEGILGYNVTRNWSVGLGGRYWAWNTGTGTTFFDFLGLPPPPQAQLARYTSERYGLFLQTDYQWGDMTPAPRQAGSAPANVPANAAAPMDWTGLYAGGYLGGGWSDDRWSDPFGSTISGGLVNSAGFVDRIHSAGPLGGGRVGVNWQTGQWVFGVEGDLSALDLRGENTCFSGIGGINCQHVVNAIGTVSGRFGFAWDRSLLYARAGAAWTNSTFTLLGNTGVNNLGVGSTNVTALGWTAGIGIEYALSKNWTSMFEYDHVGAEATSVLFPTVALINAQSIGVRESIDTLKLGVNYKFDWAGRFASSN